MMQKRFLSIQKTANYLCIYIYNPTHLRISKNWKNTLFPYQFIQFFIADIISVPR
jgi:hypothetical protein